MRAVLRYNKDMKHHLSFSETIVPKSYYKKTFDSSLDMWYHTHDYLEIMYCNSGSFTFSTLDEHKNINFSREIKRNEFLVINGNVYHRICVNGECNISNLEFEIGARRKENYLDFSAFFSNTPAIRELLAGKEKFVVLNDFFNFSKTVNAFVKYLVNTGVHSSEIVECYTYRVFLEMIDCYQSYAQKNSGIRHIRNAADYIQNNFSEKFSVQALADHVGVSKSYLERLFKANFGMTILQYIHVRRIEFVKQALLNTEYTIDEICRKYGFQSKPQLIYEFKKKEGCTPIQFRIAHNKSLSVKDAQYRETSVQL